MCDRQINLMPMADEVDRFVTAQLTDCSLHGMVITREPLQAGQQVAVRLDV